MTDFQVLVAHAVRIGLLILMAGILWRGRLFTCWFFALYVLATLLGNTMVSFWPGRFFTPQFWILKQGVYDSLKVALAIELAWRAFAAFPGAMRTARWVLSVVLTVSALALTALTPKSSFRTLWEWQPSVATAGLWVLTATALMVVWYQIPIDDWQRAIMLGLASYQLLFVLLLDVLRRHGWDLRGPVAALETLAFLGLIGYWAWAAWRPQPATQRLASPLIAEAQ